MLDVDDAMICSSMMGLKYSDAYARIGMKTYLAHERFSQSTPSTIMQPKRSLERGGSNGGGLEAWFLEEKTEIGHTKFSKKHPTTIPGKRAPEGLSKGKRQFIVRRWVCLLKGSLLGQS